MLLFLFCPETTYIRAERYNTDTATDDKVIELTHVEGADLKRKDPAAATERALQTTGEVPEKKTFVQELALFNGIYSHDSLFKFLFGPFLTLLNPAACYAVLVSGLLNSWYVGSAIILAGIFAGPPWMFNAAQIGYLGTGPFVGGMVGSIFVGFTADAVIKWMGKKNRGTYEPEFRLVFMVFSGPLCAVGMFLFGYTMAIGAAAPVCAFLQGVMVSYKAECIVPSSLTMVVVERRRSHRHLLYALLRS